MGSTTAPNAGGAGIVAETATNPQADLWDDHRKGEKGITMDNRILRVVAWLEAMADAIYLSSEETDEATRKAYIEGKASVANALKDIERT